ncbi:MAG: hypothetical protein ACI9F9_000905 [Candidatus Paceibacteria bacterium]|jgi:hypothetical protein
MEQHPRVVGTSSFVKQHFESPELSFDLDDGVLTPYREKNASLERVAPVRLVYAAAHLVMHDEYAQVDQRLSQAVAPEEIAPHIDWDSTLDLRRRLDRLGFGIAEAMDTAQRFQIGWKNAGRLIEGCGKLDLDHGFVAGAGVDHLSSVSNEDQLVAGVVYQAQFIRDQGGIPILLPLVWLCEQEYDEAGYVRVYGRIVEALEGPLFLHWLGEMFLPALAGYFPGDSFQRIMAHCPEKLRGAKLSLLDADLERRLRAELLLRDQILLTGDDFNFAGLMCGGPVTGHTTVGNLQVPTGEFSHGLLGIFDAIAEPASLALQFLARGDTATYGELMEPCERLGQHLFRTPTRHYKAGLAFLAWLNGWQPNAMLVQHEELSRARSHYFEAARLASAAGVISDSAGALRKLGKLLKTQ